MTQKKTEAEFSRQQLRKLTLDLKHIAKHLPDTPQAQRLFHKEGAIHVFKDEATMNKVTETIMNRGVYMGRIRGHLRFSHRFEKTIGYRIDRTGNRIPLYCAEMKIRGDKYHVIPRTRPSG